MAEDSQAMEGAKLIISRANTLAIEKKAEIDEYIWNQKQGIDNRENHTLELKLKNGRVVKASFSREALEDYPGKVGTEKTDSILRRMIDELKGGPEGIAP